MSRLARLLLEAVPGPHVAGNKKERVPGGAHSHDPIEPLDRYEMSV